LYLSNTPLLALLKTSTKGISVLTADFIVDSLVGLFPWILWLKVPQNALFWF
jgi:hypothetical protein